MPLTTEPLEKGPGLIRRLVVVIYDGLLLAGVIFACWAVLWLVLSPLPDSLQSHPAMILAKRCYLLGIALLFYGWFWVFGGQTLGMRAWRLKLVSTTGGTVSWRQAAARFAAAMISWAVVAMGFMWVLADRQNRTWHGILSGTRIVLLPKSIDPVSEPGAA